MTTVRRVRRRLFGLPVITIRPFPPATFVIVKPRNPPKIEATLTLVDEIPPRPT